MEDNMKELTPELIKNLNPEQMELIVELGEMAKAEANLTEQIESIRKLEEKVVGLGKDHRQNKAVYEDSEYDELLSAKSVREREIVREKIKSLMLNLIRNGLGELSLIQRQAANYGIDPKTIK
jgi:hypothetical protein